LKSLFMSLWLAHDTLQWVCRMFHLLDQDAYD
jgi:hypothetical protein